MNFQEEIKKHLGTYRKRQLGIEKAGIFYTKKYDHILPKEHGSYNILSQYRKDFRLGVRCQV